MQLTLPSNDIILPCSCGKLHQVRDPRTRVYLRCKRCGAFLLYECNGAGRDILRGWYGECPLESTIVSIGRKGDWQIEHPPLSRVHCVIERRDGKCFIRDNQSKNGTWLNENKLAEDEIRELHGGDLLRLADLYFRFLGRDISIDPAPLTSHDLGESLELPDNQPDADKLIGRVVQSYRVAMLLAQGGMGKVYLAVNPNSEEKRVLKVIIPNSVAKQTSGVESHILSRFIEEMDLAMQLSHPHIVKYYDVGQIREFLYIQMEYFNGRDLRRWFHANPATPEQVISIGIQVAQALTYAHSLGIIHRDIKPENILYNDKGEVKVIDFGIAKAITSPDDISPITRNIFIGTLRYMSPEQALLQGAKAATEKSDIYSLAATLFFCLAGVSPYEDVENITDLREKMNQSITTSLAQYCRNVPPKLTAALERALTIDPEKRFASAAEFASALQEI